VIAELNVPEIASRSLHLFAAIMAVGGAIFIRRVVSPAIKESLTTDGDDSFVNTLLRRCSILVYISVFLVIVTGFWNMTITLAEHRDQANYLILFAVKLILAVVLLLITVVLAGSRPLAARVRKGGSWWIAISILIAIAIVIVSSILKQFPDGPQWPT
jgi:uncharacterized membrane protein